MAHRSWVYGKSRKWMLDKEKAKGKKNTFIAPAHCVYQMQWMLNGYYCSPKSLCSLAIDLIRWKLKRRQRRGNGYGNGDNKRYQTFANFPLILLLRCIYLISYNFGYVLVYFAYRCFAGGIVIVIVVTMLFCRLHKTTNKRGKKTFRIGK